MMSEDMGQPDVERLFVVIRPIARRLTRQHADAEDLTQNAVVKILTNERVLNLLSNAHYPGSYVRRLVTFLWYDMLRQRRAHQSLEGLAEDTFSDKAPRRASGVSLRAVARCEIDDAHRTALWLRWVEKLSYADVAKRLGITETQAVSKVARAQDILRDYFLASKLTEAQIKEALRIIFRI